MTSREVPPKSKKLDVLLTAAGSRLQYFCVELGNRGLRCPLGGVWRICCRSIAVSAVIACGPSLHLPGPFRSLILARSRAAAVAARLQLRDRVGMPVDTRDESCGQKEELLTVAKLASKGSLRVSSQGATDASDTAIAVLHARTSCLEQPSAAQLRAVFRFRRTCR